MADTDPSPAFPLDSSRQLILLVQSLKGASASVLLALAFANRFMSHKELKLWTHCGQGQITTALQSLQAIGWVVARTTRGPWALSPDRPLPLSFLFSEPNLLKRLSSSSDSLNTPEGGTLLPSLRRRDLIRALLKAGIREPTASELAELPHMSEEYLQAHIRGARQNRLRLGAAIEAMRLAAPVPGSEARTPADRQAEVAEKIRNFLEGP